jgi:sec-independent protein translocase protein TatB
MFDIGWSELLVIGVVALIVIGPKELPGVLRMVGQWMGKIRRMASEFQGQFQEAMREAEMEDLKKHVDSLTEGLDPLESVRKEVEAATAFEDKPATPNSGATTSDGASPATLAAAETTVATAAAEAPVAPAEPATPEPDATVLDADVKEAGGRAA